MGPGREISVLITILDDHHISARADDGYTYSLLTESTASLATGRTARESMRKNYIWEPRVIRGCGHGCPSRRSSLKEDFSILFLHSDDVRIDKPSHIRYRPPGFVYGRESRSLDYKDRSGARCYE